MEHPGRRIVSGVALIITGLALAIGNGHCAARASACTSPSATGLLTGGMCIAALGVMLIGQALRGR